MKKVLVGLAGAVVLSISISGAPQGFASPGQFERKFSNCTELNKVYPGGVAKNKKVKNKGGATKNMPAIKPSIYKKNASKDRDRDGIACER
jgi:hypothetical protein